MQSTSIFGKIEFKHSHRARHINVRIEKHGLTVSLPFGKTEEEAMRFIAEKEAVILGKQNKLKAKIRENNIVIDENTTLKTLTFTVVLKKSERSNLYFRLNDGHLNIECPDTIDCRDADYQRQIWNGIEYFLKKEAKRLLPQRTQQLADAKGFTFSGVKIQLSRQRWGSCSSAKSINLSCFLMLLPQHLIDYVILHELCHTKEMNHSEKFWMWMDKVTDGESDLLRKELKKYTIPK